MTARSPRKVRTKDKRLFVPRVPNVIHRHFALGSSKRFQQPNAMKLANIRSCPTGGLDYEPMFVQKEKKSSRAAARAADAIDLLMEFATLGEYGLEYPEPVRSGSRKTTTPDVRLDDHRRGLGPQKHRHGRRPCRPGRTRVDLPGWSGRPGHEVPGVQPGRRHKTSGHRNRPTSALPEALRPPRIRLEAA